MFPVTSSEAWQNFQIPSLLVHNPSTYLTRLGHNRSSHRKFLSIHSSALTAETFPISTHLQPQLLFIHQPTPATSFFPSENSTLNVISSIFLYLYNPKFSVDLQCHMEHQRTCCCLLCIGPNMWTQKKYETKAQARRIIQKYFIWGWSQET